VDSADVYRTLDVTVKLPAIRHIEYSIGEGTANAGAARAQIIPFLIIIPTRLLERRLFSSLKKTKMG
jgi:hypothetical protein